MARTRTFGRWQPAIEISCTLSHRILHRAPSVQACLEVRTDRSRQSLSIRAKYDSGGQSRTSSDDRARSSRTSARSIGEPECLRRAMQRGSTDRAAPWPIGSPAEASVVCVRTSAFEASRSRLGHIASCVAGSCVPEQRGADEASLMARPRGGF